MRLCAEDAAALRVLCPTGIPDGVTARVIAEYGRLQYFPLGFNGVWAMLRDAQIPVVVDWDKIPSGVRVEGYTFTVDPNLHHKTKEWRGGVFRGGVEAGTVAVMFDGDTAVVELRRRDVRLPVRAEVPRVEEASPEPICLVTPPVEQARGSEVALEPSREVPLVPWVPKGVENGDMVWVRWTPESTPTEGYFVRETKTQVVVDVRGQVQRLRPDQVLMAQTISVP